MTAKLPIPLEPRHRASTGGRPAIEFCPITAELLINWLAQGNFECAFYQLPELPPWVTVKIVNRWKVEKETFGADIARARALGAEVLVKRAEDGLVASIGRDGIYKARELASLLKWRATRLNPRDFGETLDVNVSGTVEHKAVTHAPEWLQQAVKARQGQTIDHQPDNPSDRDVPSEVSHS